MSETKASLAHAPSREKRPFLTQWLLWTGAWSAVFLPVLSHCGYGPLEMEFMLGFLLSVGVAALSAAASRFRWVALALLVAVVLANTNLYFGSLIVQTNTTGVAYLAFLLCLAIFALIRPSFTLRLVGIVGATQVASAILCTPSRMMEKEWAVPTHQGTPAPTLLHVVLDEHTGIATIPDTPECRDKGRRITELFLSRGFVVFTHAYSEHANTQDSLPFFLNPMTTPESNTETVNHNSYRVKESYFFKQAGKNRRIDATFISEMDLTPALKASGSLSRTRSYSIHAGFGQAAEYFNAGSDRLTLAQWNALYWFYAGKHAPLLSPWLATLTFNSYLQKRAAEPPPISLLAGMELSVFKKRLLTEFAPATYYFGHFTVPHHPYCLDENGQLTPKVNWGGILQTSPFRPETKVERDVLYARHLGQALYADKQIAELADALDRKFSRAGAIVIVHSDHGSRLTLPLNTPGQSAAEWERLLRNCFLAIRIPGVPGGLIDRPVSMDRLINHLAKRDFASFDLDQIPSAESDPFTTP